METRIKTGTNPVTGSVSYRSKSTYDLMPTEDYKVEEFDVASSTCISTSYAQHTAVDNDGDWSLENETEYTGYRDRGYSMCTEFWSIGTTGWTCVKLKGRMKRKMTPSE